jgi:CubicO group peptidase (beta-lactamase class C family)
MGKRIRRWARRFALLFPALLAGAWALLLFFVERAPPPVALDLPSRASVVDPRHRGSIGRARGHIRSLMRERRVPGLAIAVAREGRLLWSEAFGYADREKQLPATPKTPIRLASVSKPVTAAAMARLYEQGRLDLDAPIQQYVRSFPDKGRPITARQLASHRAGIRDYRDDFEALNTTRFPTATASLVRFRDDPLLFPPDTGFRYSVYGYVLLSAVLEGAAGQSFPRLLREQVFEPLGMRDSGAENSSEASAGADRSARPPPRPARARGAATPSRRGASTRRRAAPPGRTPASPGEAALRTPPARRR